MFKFLSTSSLVKLYCISPEKDLWKMIKSKMGYAPIYLDTVIAKPNTIVTLGNITVTYDGLCVHTFMEKEALHFFVIRQKDAIELCVHTAELQNVGTFKKLIATFKEGFIDFHIGTCCITHHNGLQILVKLKDSNLVIPPYVNCAIVEKDRCFDIVSEV
jgi:hypothetical protein